MSHTDHTPQLRRADWRHTVDFRKLGHIYFFVGLIISLGVAVATWWLDNPDYLNSRWTLMASVAICIEIAYGFASLDRRIASESRYLLMKSVQGQVVGLFCLSVLWYPALAVAVLLAGMGVPKTLFYTKPEMRYGVVLATIVMHDPNERSEEEDD